MILMYHHIKKQSEDNLTVSQAVFLRHLDALKNKKIVYLDAYNPLDPSNAVITFDDGYKDISIYAVPHLKKMNFPFEVFLVGDFVSMGDSGNADFLNSADLIEIVKSGGRLQYHAKTHPHLETIYDKNILEAEILTPSELRLLDREGFKWFAYPFCAYNSDVIDIVKKHYKGARSGKGLGNNDFYTLESLRMDENTEINDFLK
ncbi:MAG: polysaccharide deacetylase family protein [Elusimicrobiota bacterium]|jgi:peptidoglycan/xylan/chitin deacetylase (PgdA/CDA1 family)|nr:polysaccharide deacetylase family protein [Elusimicrobiota bacterium]